MFQANGEGDFGIDTRCKKAKTTFGRLHEFWSYLTLTYGNVAWKLT